MSMSITTARKHLGPDSNHLSDEKIQEIIFNLEKLSVLTYDIFIEQLKENKIPQENRGTFTRNGGLNW